MAGRIHILGAPGGRLHKDHVTFMTWAAAYDDGGVVERSRRLHEEWLSRLPCPVVRFATDVPVDALVEAIAPHVAAG